MATEKYQKLIELLEEGKEHVEKFFEKEVNAAGTRLRKVLQEVRKLSQEVRQEVQSTKESRKESSSPTASN